MLLVDLLIGTTSFIALALCVLIYISNPKKRVNQSLSFFLASVFVWLATNLLTNLSPTKDIALFFGRSTLIGASLIPFAFLMFVNFYLGNKTTWKSVLAWAVLPLLVLSATPTSLNISSIGVHGVNTKTGSIYLLLVIELLVYFAIGLARLYRRYKMREVSSTQRAQIQYIFAGTIITAIPAIFINAILPIVSNQDTAILYGPNVVIILAAFTTIAIVKHRLLDIRLIVARFLAYVFLIGSLISIYSLIVFTFTQKIGFSKNLSFIKTAVPFLAAILIAVSFGRVKRFFDHISNKLFYQDAYDPQEFLDELNKILVSTLDLNILLNRVLEQVNKNLKSETSFFTIKNTKHNEERAIGEHASKINPQELKDIFSLVAKSKTKVVVTDTLDESNEFTSILNKNRIAVVIRLTSTSEDTRGVGYLMLGPKKSGSSYGRSDIRILDIVTNELVIAIQNAIRFEEIQTFNITLQKEVEQATQGLRKANSRLKELDETKDDFISMASHQLRTPLTSVKGYISMVLDGDAGKISASQQKLLNQAFTSSQRMVYLIADLLNVSRLKTGKFVIERAPTNLADVVKEEIGQLGETVQLHHLELSYDKPEHFPVVDLDVTKTRQVIMNFLDNAVYYTPSGGKITVGIEDKPKSIEFTVSDNGIGVPKSEVHHLFNKFYRAGNARKARPDGTGLGLFMAKKVVIAQGGAIIFHSEEGKGSTFGFSFPKDSKDVLSTPKSS